MIGSAKKEMVMINVVEDEGGDQHTDEAEGGSEDEEELHDDFNGW